MRLELHVGAFDLALRCPDDVGDLVRLRRAYPRWTRAMRSDAAMRTRAGHPRHRRGREERRGGRHVVRAPCAETSDYQ